MPGRSVQLGVVRAAGRRQSWKHHRTFEVCFAIVLELRPVASLAICIAVVNFQRRAFCV